MENTHINKIDSFKKTDYKAGRSDGAFARMQREEYASSGEKDAAFACYHHHRRSVLTHTSYYSRWPEMMGSMASNPEPTKRIIAGNLIALICPEHEGEFHFEIQRPAVKCVRRRVTVTPSVIEERRSSQVHLFRRKCILFLLRNRPI